MHLSDRAPFSPQSSRPHGTTDGAIARMLAAIKTHLGGDEMLAWLMVSDYNIQDRVSFRLIRPNPKGVHSVIISIESVEPNEFFAMDCYGAITPGCLRAPLVASAKKIIPENLATVLGKLAELEMIHHRHY
jgi:hypothetical protein